jgi:DNA-binding FrmR family transcriptional regulator
MTKALPSVALGMLNEHTAHSVADAVKEGGSEADSS